MQYDSPSITPTFALSPEPSGSYPIADLLLVSGIQSLVLVLRHTPRLLIIFSPVLGICRGGS